MASRFQRRFRQFVWRAMTPNDALTTLQSLKASFQHDDEPNLGEFERVNDEIVAMLPNLTLDVAQKLFDALEELAAIIRTRQHTIHDKLIDLGPKRRAMKGYGHLRAHRRGQRLEKSV